MHHNIYCIYDKKAKAYTLPFYYQHDGQALRIFTDWVNDIDNPFSKHPEDYSLNKIGTYDENLATIEQSKIEVLAEGAQLKQELI